MSNKAEYIPLPELDQARFNFPVPDFVKQQERILVNPTHLQRLGYIGGFTEVYVRSYAGEQTQTNAGIAGSGDGVGYASATASVKKAGLGHNYFEQERRLQAVPLSLELNSTAITEKVEQRAQKQNTPVTNPELWAKQLDAATRRQAFKAGAKHMLHPESHGGLTGYMGFSMLTSIQIYLLSGLAGPPAEHQISLETLFTMNNLAPAMNSLRGWDWRSQGFGFFMLPIDRVAIGALYAARPGSIVKAAQKQ